MRNIFFFFLRVSSNSQRSKASD